MNLIIADNVRILSICMLWKVVNKLDKTEGAIKNGKSRDTGNIWWTRHRADKQNKKHDTEN